MRPQEKLLVTLHTRLSIEECKQRLAANTDREKFAFTSFGYAGSKEILGRVRGDSIRLQKRRNYGNSFAPFFYAQLIPTADGTRVEGRFAMHPAAKIFMAFWYSALALFALTFLLRPQPSLPGTPPQAIIGLIVAIAMALFAFALIKFGGWLSRNEPPVILTFLKQTLEATDPN